LGPSSTARPFISHPRARAAAAALDIYAAAKAPGGFAPARLLDGPFNGASSESDFTLSRDGRWAMFWRSGEGETAAIHIAQKAGDAWSEPTPLSAAVNNGPFNFTPSFSRDGRKIRYASTRQRDGQAEGLADIYEAPLEFASLD
jgi:hypothetical protein